MTVAVARPDLGAMTHSQQQKHFNMTWRAAIRLPEIPHHITAQTHHGHKALHFNISYCKLLFSCTWL